MPALCEPLSQSLLQYRQNSWPHLQIYFCIVHGSVGRFTISLQPCLGHICWSHNWLAFTRSPTHSLCVCLRATKSSWSTLDFWKHLGHLFSFCKVLSHLSKMLTKHSSQNLQWHGRSYNSLSFIYKHISHSSYEEPLAFLFRFELSSFLSGSPQLVSVCLTCEVVCCWLTSSLYELFCDVCKLWS